MNKKLFRIGFQQLISLYERHVADFKAEADSFKDGPTKEHMLGVMRGYEFALEELKQCYQADGLPMSDWEEVK